MLPTVIRAPGPDLPLSNTRGNLKGQIMQRWRPRSIGVLLSVLVSVVASPGWSAPLSNAEPALQALAVQARDTSLPEEERVDAVKALAGWGTGQVRDVLLALLKDSVPAIRETAAIGLGWRGNGEAIPALRERAEAQGEAPGVRAAALDSLGKIGDVSARDAVLRATNDADPRIRRASFGALTTGPLASPADRIPLLRRVVEDTGMDPLMRCEAIQELGKEKDKGSIPLLIRLLEAGPRIPMPVPSASPSQQDIMRLRFQQSRDLRAWAASSLGALEAREALPLLLKAAREPDDFFLRVTSMTALGILKAPEALPVFVQGLYDPFPDVRALALMGLAQVGDSSSGDAVVARLSDPVPIVRAQAVGALVELRDPRARTELENLRRRELDSSVQQVLEAALARLPR
jgi:HEAT repeat protein